MALDPGILDSVTNSNFKTLAEQVATNAAAHQQRLQLLAESSLGRILKNLNETDVEEAQAIRTVSTSDLAGKISELSAAVASIQQMIKGAQTTLPETGR